MVYADCSELQLLGLRVSEVFYLFSSAQKKFAKSIWGWQQDGQCHGGRGEGGCILEATKTCNVFHLPSVTQVLWEVPSYPMKYNYFDKVLDYLCVFSIVSF